MVRVEINGKRHYEIIVNGEKVHYPSVTTILSVNDDPEKWNTIAKNIGVERFDLIKDKALNAGTIVHRMCELYSDDSNYVNVCNIIKDEFKHISNEYIQQGIMYFMLIRSAGFFDQIKEHVDQEIFVYNSICGGYAGAIDKVYLNHNDELILADFKTSSTPKLKSSITNYYMQVAAYYFAYYNVTNKVIKNCQIWMVSKNHQVQVFTLELDEIKYWFQEFLKLRKTFDEKMKLN